MLMLPIMAGTNELDTGQFLTYLFIYILPYFIHFLVDNLLPTDPVILKSTTRIFVTERPWFLRGGGIFLNGIVRLTHHRTVPCKKVKQYKKPTARLKSEGDSKLKRLRNYLFPLAVTTFRVGCRIEEFIRRIGRLGRPPPPSP